MKSKILISGVRLPKILSKRSSLLGMVAAAGLSAGGALASPCGASLNPCAAKAPCAADHSSASPNPDPMPNPCAAHPCEVGHADEMSTETPCAPCSPCAPAMPCEPCAPEDVVVEESSAAAPVSIPCAPAATETTKELPKAVPCAPKDRWWEYEN